MIGAKRDVLRWLIDAPDGRYQINAYHRKRSLTANAYFHVLVGKIAEVLKTSDAEVKNTLLQRYGQIDTDAGYIIVDNEKDCWRSSEYLHLRPTSATKTLDNGRVYRVCMVIRGSHTYNSKEMARLIDGTIDEAKTLGIETLPPQELERLKGYEKHYMQ